MSNLFTRPVFRDRIRRKLQQKPPIDYGGGVGQQPTAYPTPTNQSINDALADALSDINNVCQAHVTQISVAVTGQSASSQGPIGVYLGDLTYAGQTTASVAPVGLIRDIQRVLWQDSAGSLTLLQQIDVRAQDRQQNSYYSDVPSVPSFYYIEGYVLYLQPSPSVSGTAVLTCGTGYVGLQTETDVIDQFPIDFQTILEAQALWRLSITQTMDIEAQQRAASYGPIARAGMATIEAWKNGQSGTVQPSIAVQTYRQGYGTVRMRR